MPGKIWTEDELQVLRTRFARFARRLELSEIDAETVVKSIKIKGKSPVAIRSKLIRLGLLKVGAPKKRWTAAEDEQLRVAIANKEGSVEIAGRTSDAIANRITFLTNGGEQGLVDSTLSNAIRDGAKLHGLALTDYQQAIERFARTRDHLWFYWKFGVSRRAFTERRAAILGEETNDAKLGCLSSRISRQNSLKLLFHGKRRRDAVAAKMLEDRAQIDLLDEALRPKTRYCQSCIASEDGHWYEDLRFFKYRSIQRSDKKSSTQHWVKDCLCCLASRRSSKEGKRDEKLIRLQSINLNDLPFFARKFQALCPKLYGNDLFGRLGRNAFEKYLDELGYDTVVTAVNAGLALYRSMDEIRELIGGLEILDFSGEQDIQNEIQLLVQRTSQQGINRRWADRNFEPSYSLRLSIFRLFGLPEYLRAMMYLPPEVE